MEERCFYLIFMNLSVDIISLIIVAIVLGMTVIAALLISNKLNEKMIVKKTYGISNKKYEDFQEISKRALSNTTLTFSREDSSLDLEIDRGYAGYENIVHKGVELLKKDGFKIPSLEDNR